MTEEAPRYILDRMVKATVSLFFTLVTAYTEISTVLAILWSNIVTFATCEMKTQTTTTVIIKKIKHNLPFKVPLLEPDTVWTTPQEKLLSVTETCVRHKHNTA